MKVLQTGFKDLLLLEPTVIRDDRGYFLESYNEARFWLDTGLNIAFVQDNESVSSKGVLRGLHFQLPPYSQAKLIRIAQGAVLDVVVDLRRSQPTYMQHYKVVLSSENQQQLFVPEGFAHGFLVLEEQTVFSYKCSKYYHRESDCSIRWNDPKLAIDWGTTDPVLSEKDKHAMLSDQFDNPFM